MGTRVLVTGGAGFIGDHLVRYLKERGYWVRAVDVRSPLRKSVADEASWTCDMRVEYHALSATRDMEEIYALAADHGGVGHISAYPATVFWNNAMINLVTAWAASENKIRRYFFPSSVCVYPKQLKTNPETASLREEDAFPADPEHAYGWEKLFAEIMLPLELRENVRIGRLHTIYGPWCAWDGGREKVIPALCRKIAIAELTGDPRVEIWGDGGQTRTFCYIDDAVEMIHRLMRSDYHQPLNIGSDRLITINELADKIARIAGVEIEKVSAHGSTGERYRGTDLTRMREVLHYEPQTSLEAGLAATYKWVKEQVECSQSA